MAGEQPKKPAGGAFGRFLTEKRPEFQKECAGKPITAVTKLAAERWKAVGEAEKAEYEKQYQAAKTKFEEDMKAFLAAGGEKKATKGEKRKLKEGKAKKNKKDPQAPKKPAGGAYGCFLGKHRAAFTKECEGKGVTAVAKLAGEKWKALGEDEKKPFEEEYKVKMAAFKEAMASYVPLPGAEDEDDEPVMKRARQSKEQKEATQKEKAEQKEADKKAKAEAKEAKAAAKKAPKAKAKAKAKGKAKAKAKATPESKVELQATVAAKAEKAGLTSQLLKLAAREDIIASGKSQTAMLKALEENDGLLHPAKRALLGA